MHPEVGDEVLVHHLGTKGKHKLEDRWEENRYEVVKQVDPGIPVLVVKRVDGVGRQPKLHRNHLLPVKFAFRSEEEKTGNPIKSSN